MTHGHGATSANVKGEATPLAPTSDWHHLTGFYQCPSRASRLEPAFLNRYKAQPPTEQQPMDKAAAQINSIPGMARHWLNHSASIRDAEIACSHGCAGEWSETGKRPKE